MINFNNKKVLIIRFSSLGDIVLTTPIIRALKNNFPDIILDYLVKEKYVDALRFNPKLNKIIPFTKDTSIKQIRELIKKEKYDYIIDLHSSLRSKLITFGLKAKTFSIKKNRIKKFLLVKFKINLLKNYDLIPEIYAKAIPDLELDEAGAEIYLEKQTSIRENLIGICPGAFHFTKSWGENNYLDLIKFLIKLNYKVALFGGKNDMELCERLSSYDKNIINYSTNDNLLEMAKNMLKCKLILGNDSGLMHVAAALKLPVIVIFTSTVKNFGFEPYKAKSIIIENNDIMCRPCSHIGLDKCPKGHFNCANSISPSDVFNKIKLVIKDV